MIDTCRSSVITESAGTRSTDCDLCRTDAATCSGSAGILPAVFESGETEGSRRDPSAALRTSAGATETIASTCGKLQVPSHYSGVKCGPNGGGAYFFFPRAFSLSLPAGADFRRGGADFDPDGCPFAGGAGSACAFCLDGAEDLAGPAAELTAWAPFFGFSSFFFSSTFLGGSLMPASLRKTLAWSSGLRALPRSCAWKKSSSTLSNFGPRSKPTASSSVATPGNAWRRGFHLNM